MKKLLSSLLLLVAGALPASSATIVFDLMGNAGTGLLSGNENGAISGTPGSGGEFGAGISYDDVTNVLTINVAWGSGNGFTNLSGDATMGHVHGPTPGSGVTAFSQNVGVLFNLDDGPTWNPNAINGAITNRTLSLTEGQEAELLAGRYYINIHTATNGGGEIRGNMVVVPEPSSLLLGFAAAGTFLLRRRSRS